MADEVLSGLDSDSDGIVGGPWIETESKRLNAAKALLVGMALIMVGNGLQGAVLGVRVESEGFGLAVSGVVMACFFLGFLLGARMAEHFLAAVGHIRVFAALASLASGVSILHLLWIHPVSWGLLRTVFGLCMAGIYVVVESWLNDMATNQIRGRLLAMYMVVSIGGLTVGQFLLNSADPSGFELFVISSVLISVALVPITLSATSAPPLSVPEPLSLRKLFGVAPTGVVTSFCTGISHGALLGIGAVYAASEGLSTSRIALFLVASTTGAIVFQWPLGALSDRVSRRGVILVVAIAATFLAAIQIMVEPGTVLSLALMFGFGGATFPLYALGIALTADWVAPSQLTGASATLVRVVGVGAVIGPALGGAIMALTVSWAFFIVLAAAHVVIVASVGWRIITRDGIPVIDQSRFSPWPMRASAMAANLLRRPARPSRRSNRIPPKI